MKKFISILLCFLLVFAIAVPSFAAARGSYSYYMLYTVNLRDSYGNLTDILVEENEGVFPGSTKVFSDLGSTVYRYIQTAQSPTRRGYVVDAYIGCDYVT